MALSDVGRAWTFARKIEDLLGLQREVREGLDLAAQRLRELEDRMTRLEARQDQIFTEARSAAAMMAARRHLRRGDTHHPARGAQ